MRYTQLTAADRGAIDILLREQYTHEAIAKKLGKDAATVSREISKRGTPMGYFAGIAQAQYERMRRRCRKRKKMQLSTIQSHVCEKLQLGWSPEQISGRLKVERSPWYVCPETIYRFLYSDPWAKEEGLYQFLRYGRRKRKRHAGRSVHRVKIPNRVSIHLRPAIVTTRTEYGHCESDSVIYPYKQAINTINELATGKVAFTKLERKTAALTATAMIRGVATVGAKTYTVDNGSEFTDHVRVTRATRVPVFFADPYCSNQRGANENCNLLLRGYLPKRHSILDVTQEDLDDIAEELNTRPRKRLGYRTPNEMYQLLQEGGCQVALAIRM